MLVSSSGNRWRRVCRVKNSYLVTAPGHGQMSSTAFLGLIRVESRAARCRSSGIRRHGEEQRSGRIGTAVRRTVAVCWSQMSIVGRAVQPTCLESRVRSLALPAGSAVEHSGRVLAGRADAQSTLHPSERSSQGDRPSIGDHRPGVEGAFDPVAWCIPAVRDRGDQKGVATWPSHAAWTA